MPKQEPGVAKRPSGMSCTPPKLRVLIRGLPRVHCGPKGLRVTVDVLHSAKLASVAVLVNGRTVRRTKRARFVVRIPVAKLHTGRNRVVVKATDASGRATSHVASFKSC
jgi:hypothetical protein